MIRFASMFVSFVATAGAVALAPGGVAGGSADRCAVVGTAEASRILGGPVMAPDAVSRANGACIFLARDLSRDDELSFTILTAADLDGVRATGRAAARTCVGAPESRSDSCARYRRLATVTTLTDLYAARTAGTAEAVSGIGERAAIVVDRSALADSTRIVVIAHERIVEAEVTIDDAFDRARTLALARLLLDRTVGKLGTQRFTPNPA